MPLRPLLSLCLLLALPLPLAAVPAAPTSGPVSALGLVRIPAASLDLPGGPADWADVWAVEREEGWALVAADAVDLARLDAAGVSWEWDWEQTVSLHAVPDLSCFATVDEVVAELGRVAAEHPRLVRLVDYGDSWRRTISGGTLGDDLLAVRISDAATDDRPKPVFFVMSAIHAREMATAEISRELIRRLVAGFEQDPGITALLREAEVWVVPVANPDGRRKAETGLSWRKNVDDVAGCAVTSKVGVDLNRNSSHHWNEGGSSGNPCDETYRGPSAASEPEVAALEALFATLWTPRGTEDDTVPADEERTAGLMVTLHSYSQWILRPLGYRKAESANERSLKAIGDRFADFTGYRSGISSIALYIASGATDDVVYGIYGVPAFTFEVGSAFFEKCDKVPALVEKNVTALLWGSRLAARPYRKVFGPELELPGVVVVAEGDPAVTIPVSVNRGASGADVARVVASIDLPPDRSERVFEVSGPQVNAAGLLLDVDLSGLGAGKHLLHVEAIGADGIAGPPGALWIQVGRPDGSVPLDRR